MSIVLAIFLGCLVAAGLLVVLVTDLRRRHIHQWLGAYLRSRVRWRTPTVGPVHVMFCFVDHFEPQWKRVPYAQERARVERWRQDYPRLCQQHRDADGRFPIHTFFYPAEEYRPEHLDDLVELCRGGYGEIEIHLHHHDDTDANMRATLRTFTRQLVERHHCLPVDPVTQKASWAFIHGNWALDNARPDGWFCGVNNELQLLREEGCYADFTLPCAPDPSQTSTINSIYYATDDVNAPRSHDKGVHVAVGRASSGDLMIVQGPLGLNWRSRKFGLLPRIDSGDVRTHPAPTENRVDAWVNAGISVAGRPEWVFVKVHTHGTQDQDTDALLGPPVDRMFSYLERQYNDGKNFVLHYVSARELFNIVKAAEAGEVGDPGQYRDYQVPRPTYAQSTRDAHVA